MRWLNNSFPVGSFADPSPFLRTNRLQLSFSKENHAMSCRIRTSAALKVLSLLSLLFPLTLFSQTKLASTSELALRAEIVAVGKVASLISEWNENRSMIRTRVTLSVDQFVKGGHGSPTLTLYVPGGEVGAVGEVYSDMPTFRPDEEVVVFAERDVENRYRVSGGPQGKLTVLRDKTTGVPMVAPGQTLEMLTSEVKQAVDVKIDKR